MRGRAALVDGRAELIGINTAIYSETGGYQGIGFAVPSNLARKVVDQLLAHGRVVRGWIGITRVSDLNEETSAALGIRGEQGVVVMELVRQSPADRSGVLPGDVIVAVDGRRVEDAGQLRNELAGAEVGAALGLTLVRQGRRMQLRVLVEERRPDA
jgi:S1-C subfamily serine protease